MSDVLRLYLESQAPCSKPEPDIVWCRGVARLAACHGVPCIGLAGTLGKGYTIANTVGIGAVFSIIERPRTLDSAIEDAYRLVSESATQIANLIQLSFSISHT